MTRERLLVILFVIVVIAASLFACYVSAQVCCIGI